MSWDALNGIRQGEQQAKASERAKRRGAALARSGGSGKSSSRKSGFTRAQGRKAVARSGRGICIKALKNGGNFKAVMDYNNDPAKNAQIVSTNCGDAQGALRAMLAASRLRPDILEPVGKMVLSLPPAAGKDEKRFGEFVDEHRRLIGLDDSFPYISFSHSDQQHLHVHLEFSRVSLTGKVHDQRNIGLRCAAAEQVIEHKFNLHLVPRSEFKNTRVTKNEIEMGLRKGVQPPRMQIAAAINAALRGDPKPSTAMFIERLNAAHVGVMANIASTGRMNGFSFIYEGVAFTASKISKEYGWKSLSTKIDFDPEHDAELLKNLDGELGTASRDLALANRAVSQLSDAVASVSNEKEVAHERQNRDAPQTPGIDTRTGAAGSSNAEPSPAAGGRDHKSAEIRPAATDTRADSADRAPAPDRAIQRLGAPEQPTARPTDVGTAQKPSAVQPSARPAQPIITAPDLRVERWRRAERLLAEYRQGIKSKTEIADLDRLASDAGHEPADIVSAHATTVDILPAEVAQDVLKAVQTKEMREYVEKEFVAAKRRSEAQTLAEKHSAVAEAPAFRPK